jgi:indole-3-glycerol phosphate synthase
MILDKIVEKVKERYEIIKKNKPLSMLLNEIAFKEEHEFIFYDLFKEKNFIFICECKKASPSKGIIKEDFNYLEIAKEYEEAGADVISCLTEPFFFLGSDAYLKDIKRNVSIPVLRKDFIIDPYQIYESKALGADVILLIVAILSDKQLKDYIELAHSLGMSCLVETHNESEIEKAIEAGGYAEIDECEDYEFAARMLASGAKARNIPEPLVRFRVSDRDFKKLSSFYTNTLPKLTVWTAFSMVRKIATRTTSFPLSKR